MTGPKPPQRTHPPGVVDKRGEWGSFGSETHPPQTTILTQNLAEGKSSLNKRPLRDPSRPPPRGLCLKGVLGGLGWGGTQKFVYQKCPSDCPSCFVSFGLGLCILSLMNFFDNFDACLSLEKKINSMKLGFLENFVIKVKSSFS